MQGALSRPGLQYSDESRHREPLSSSHSIDLHLLGTLAQEALSCPKTLNNKVRGGPSLEPPSNHRWLYLVSSAISTVHSECTGRTMLVRQGPRGNVMTHSESLLNWKAQSSTLFCKNCLQCRVQKVENTPRSPTLFAHRCAEQAGLASRRPYTS